MTTGRSAEARYCPWVGERYWEQEQRWLLLGESSFGPGLTDKQAVQQMIRANHDAPIDPSQNVTYRLLSGTERLMTGRDLLDSAGTKDFWQTVAFYNYLRENTQSSTQRPTIKQFKAALPAFNEVICQTKPDVVLVLGVKLWMALPGEQDGWVRGKERDIVMPVTRLASRKLSVWTGYAKCAGLTHRFQCFPVMHPASKGFAAGAWRDWMAAAKRMIAASSSSPY